MGQPLRYSKDYFLKSSMSHCLKNYVEFKKVLANLKYHYEFFAFNTFVRHYDKIPHLKAKTSPFLKNSFRDFVRKSFSILNRKLLIIKLIIIFIIHFSKENDTATIFVHDVKS